MLVFRFCLKEISCTNSQENKYNSARHALFVSPSPSRTNLDPKLFCACRGERLRAHSQTRKHWGRKCESNPLGEPNLKCRIWRKNGPARRVKSPRLFVSHVIGSPRFVYMKSRLAEVSSGRRRLTFLPGTETFLLINGALERTPG